MKYTTMIAALCVAAVTGQTAKAQFIEDTYVAFIGKEDLFSSSGKRLKTAGAVLQQDRANYHKFGIRHVEDTYDSFFTTAENRAKIPEAINLPKDLEKAIVSGYVRPLRIKIWIYDSGEVDYLEISPAY